MLLRADSLRGGGPPVPRNELPLLHLPAHYGRAVCLASVGVSAALLTALVSLANSPARADTFDFLDSGESVSVTINGVAITGNGGRVSNFFTSGEFVSFNLTGANTGQATVSGFTNLLEPGSTTVSDRFVESFTNGSSTYFVAFGSDPDLPAIPAGALDLTTVPIQGLPPNPYFEDGTLQKVATAILPG